ncbi:hypothetical protein [Caproiciproducens sp. CPB-2]|uniref:hypothetical protein n=1 Tax=Caproiciproducens sp. CPB-2 TaxID=3030017 RepID=UPI0023DA63DC|nr:hypothetical protein [Caproiciproducens sp. CPB-2]MDF1495164.1 hypothetical protein [Caproiciproducens sp. CPB-2]
MSLFDLGWQELYVSMDYQDYLEKQSLLRNANILFKTKIQNNSFRVSLNNLDGRNASLSRGAPAIQDYYRILVKKQDYDYAKHIVAV